jgi:hypothetical protein
MQKVHSGPAFSAGIRLGDAKPLDTVPGPGEYQQPDPDGGRAYTMGSKHKERSELPHPGPGEYAVQQTIRPSGPAFTMTGKPVAASPLLYVLSVGLLDH